MLNIPEELKNIYRTISNQRPPESLRKKLIITFPALNLVITNERIVRDSFSLTESICSESELTFGACEAAYIDFTVYDIIHDLTGHEFTIVQEIGNYSMPLGTYKVAECKRQSDRRFKTILAYDKLLDTDTDISSWYNSVTFPITLKNLKQSLLTHMGIDYIEQTVTNDDLVIEKTINPGVLLARELLRKICELNAGFGKIGRDGKFKVIQLSGLGLYPSETLYPSEDLFPSESGEYITSGYRNVQYEDYIVEPITQLKIRQDDEDVGTSAGDGNNVYEIMGNYLVFGKSAAEMQTIAENIFLQIKNKYYRPHRTTMQGLPYLEPGDAVTTITSNDAIETFIFRRTLTGVQSLTDEITATGNRIRCERRSVQSELKQLKGKTLSIRKSIDQLSIEMIDMEEGLQSQITLTAGQLQTQITDNKNELQSQITQTAGQLQTEITDNYNQLNSVITQTAGSLQTQITDNKNDANSQINQLSNQISFKVSRGDISSELSLEPGQVRLTSNRLVVDSTNFKLDESGNVTVTGNITGSTISGSSLTSVGGSNSTTINNGTIQTSYINLYQGGYGTTVQAGSITLTGSGLTIISPGNIQVSTINGSTPLTVSNRIYYQTLLYDDENYNPQVVAYGNNFRPHSYRGSGVISCGSPAYLWSVVYAASTTISSSDGNLKELQGDITDAEKRVAKKLKGMIRKFKFKEAIQEKGNSARIHFGVIAQDVKTVFEEEGLNPHEYALFCSDTWYEKDGKAVDENERNYTKEDKGVVEITQLGIRYEELLCFIIGGI